MDLREWVVLKFGGTSVASRAAWETIAGVVRGRLEEGLRPVVVCSALAGVSDALDALLEAAVRGEGRRALPAIAARHEALARELGVEASLVSDRLAELERLVEGISLVGEASPRLRARVLAAGELMATRLGAAFLAAEGLEPVWLDVREVLRARAEPGANERRAILAASCDDDPEGEVSARLRALGGRVVVTQGFIARGEGGETVLLGRGGSDASAAYLAAKLGARRCEIWTSVPGIFTASPAEVPTARLLDRLDYDEAQEIASCGAKVLHPRCIPPCRKAGIPIHVRSTDEPEAPGTVVARLDSPAEAGVKAIARRSGVLLVSMDTLGMWQQVGFLAEVFDVFRRHGVSVDLVSTSQSNVTVSLDAAAALVDRASAGALVADLGRHCAARLIGPCAAVSLVGRGIRGILHRLGPALEVFEERKVHLVSQAASDLNLTFVVEEADADRLVARLHALLFAGAEAPLAEEEPAFFVRRADELLDLARSLGTPLFAYDLEAVEVAAGSLACLRSVDRIFYAMKANWHPEVLATVERSGLGFECVSAGELRHLFAALPGLDPGRVLFTPNFAPRREYEEAIGLGVHVTVDGLHPFERWPELFAGREVLVRLDPGEGRGHHAHVRTAGATSKFGLAAPDLGRLRAAVERAGATVVGLHAHVGSGVLDPGAWAETAAFLGEAARAFGGSVRLLDVGGGLGVPDRPGVRPLDLTALDSALARARRAYPGLDLWLEPGRYLVARAGALLASVTQVKDKAGVRYVGVDAGMNSLIRPALYGAFHRIVNLSRLADETREVVDVVGPICETGDTLGHARHIAPAREGDVLAIADVGAYGRAMSSSYNLRPPAEEAVLGGAGRGEGR